MTRTGNGTITVNSSSTTINGNIYGGGKSTTQTTGYIDGGIEILIAAGTVNINNENISHSAIIVEVNGEYSFVDETTLSAFKVKSKWGEDGVYEHNAYDCKYGKDNSNLIGFSIYRPRTTNTYTLSNSMETIEKSKQIYVNDHPKYKYELYELNVNFEIDKRFIKGVYRKNNDNKIINFIKILTKNIKNP